MTYTTNDELKSLILAEIKKVERETDMNTLTKMKDILNRTFGEERNQLVKPSLESIEQYIKCLPPSAVLTWRNSTNLQVMRALRENNLLDYRIIIHFPDVEIKNSRGRTFNIKDLYVSQAVSPAGKLKGPLRGLVTSYFFTQYQIGYMHSHLQRFDSSTNVGPTFGPFCLGTGEISMVIAVLTAAFDEINFQLFCFHLRNYVHWESLEGTPHIPFSNVRIDTGVPLHSRLLPMVASDIAKSIASKLLKKFDNQQMEEFIQVGITQSKIEVKATDKLQILMAQMLSAISDNCGQDLKVTCAFPYSSVAAHKDSLGKFYPIDRPRVRSIIFPDRPALYFKNKEIRFQTTGSEPENNDNIVYVNPLITEQFNKQLSAEFTRTAIVAEGTSWYEDTCNNIQKASSPDPVVVQEVIKP